MTSRQPPDPPCFDATFQASLRELILWRRDVRRFKTEPVDPELISSLIELAASAPSVGHCQPWRFVLVERRSCRDEIKATFSRANADALEGYSGERRRTYARLKLEGLEAAPVHLAIFADEATDAGSGLGRQTMPESLRYSVVAAIQTLWLAARAHGLGVGWVSILEPERVAVALEVPKAWNLVAYLCLGWPQEEHVDPELDRKGWQSKIEAEKLTFRR